AVERLQQPRHLQGAMSSREGIMRRRVGLVAGPLVVGLASLSPAIASADEPSTAATPDAAPHGRREEETVEVRVIGDRADALQRVPGSGTVIGSKDIQRAAPVDTAEMLRRVPGVQVRQEYSGGNRLDI